MRPTVPVPRRLLQPLWAALGVAVLFLTVSTLQGIVRPGFNSWHQAVSALSLGPGGWIQQVNFIAFGVAITATAPAWRRVMAGGTGEFTYPALTALIGISMVAAGIIPQDPAPGYDPEQLRLTRPTLPGLLHLAIAGVAALSSVVSLFIMGARLARDPDWPGWAGYSVAMACLTIVCVVVYGIWSVQASGFAGTFERGAIIIPVVWAFTFLRRLSAGTPFMSKPS